MKQPLFGAVITGVTSTSVKNYWFITNTFSDTIASTTEAPREIPFPNTFTLSNLFVKVQTAPSTGKSYAFTVYKNGVATGLTVTISDTNTTATDSVDTVTFNAGDTVSLESSPTGTPTAPGNWYFNLVCDSGSSAYGVILGADVNLPATGATNFAQAFGGNASGWYTTDANAQNVIASAGTLTNLYLMTSAAPGVGKSYAMGISQNGGAPVLTATISGANTTTNDTTDTVTITAGDTISIQSTPSGTPTQGIYSWGIQWNPTTNGESVFGMGNSTAPSTTVTQYEQALGSGRTSWNATESARFIVPGAYTFTRYYVKISAAPSPGSYVFTLNKNNTNTALSVTLSGSTTTGNITGQSVTFSQGDTLDLQSVPSSTPGSVSVHLGYTIFITPTATNAKILTLLGVG